MDIVYQVCAGLDVHKQSVSVCIRKVGADGKTSGVVREFSTMTDGILQMS